MISASAAGLGRLLDEAGDAGRARGLGDRLAAADVARNRSRAVGLDAEGHRVAGLGAGGPRRTASTKAAVSGTTWSAA